MAIRTVSVALKGLRAVVRQRQPRKFFRFAQGQHYVMERIKAEYTPDSRPVVWLHAASLGEYGIARPLVSEMSRRGWRVVVTFFSPTGYEALIDSHPGADHVWYLPLDTPSNARTFIDTIRPQKAVFMVSEYWFNYLDQLRSRGIDTYLVSAKITDRSACFRWYGYLYRRCLDIYRHIFVVDSGSQAALARLGHTGKVTDEGNPLFDNAVERADTAWSHPVLDRYCAGHDVMVAGSIHDDHDLQLVTAVVEAHPDRRYIFVPHEVTDTALGAIETALTVRSRRLSQCTAETDLSDTAVLIVDSVGSLAYIYRYGSSAYVGGGFTRYLHSLIEAVVYGLPVSFGPNIQRKITPSQLIELGLGTMVRDTSEILAWYASLPVGEAREQLRERASDYVRSRAHTAPQIIDRILA